MAFKMKQTRSDLMEVACKEDDQDLPHLKAIKDAARAALRNDAKTAGKK
jgi:hypothetical protein